MMISNILQMPTQDELSDREFDRTGSTDWTRALDEAELIGREAFGRLRGPAELRDRVERLDRQVCRLQTWRADDCETIIDIKGAGNCIIKMPLSSAASFLRELVAGMPKPRPRTILRLVE